MQRSTWLLTLLGLAIVFIVLTTTVLKLHPFLALLLAAFGYGIASDRMSLKEVVDAVNLGFGGTIGSIGIVILAGSIIIITGSGGAFGKILQSSGIGDIITTHLGESTSLRILLPFAVAAALKTAQGSSTVAIITTAGILAPMLESLHLDGGTGKALAVVAIRRLHGRQPRQRQLLLGGHGPLKNERQGRLPFSDARHAGPGQRRGGGTVADRRVCAVAHEPTAAATSGIPNETTSSATRHNSTRSEDGSCDEDPG